MQNDIVGQTFDDFDLSDIRLPMVTVYIRPRDYPDKIVARIGDGTKGPTTAVLLFESVEACEAAIPPGFVKLARHPMDDANIHAVYI